MSHHRPRSADAVRKVQSDFSDLFTSILAEIELLKDQNRVLLAALKLTDPQPRHASNDDLTASLDEMDESRRQHDRILLERVQETTAHVLMSIIEPLQHSITGLQRSIADLQSSIADLQRSNAHLEAELASAMERITALEAAQPRRDAVLA